MTSIKVTESFRQIIKTISALKNCANLTSTDFTILLSCTAPMILHNVYFYHAAFRTAGVLHFVRDFTSDGNAITTPMVEYAITDPYAWIRSNIPHFWDQGQMAISSIGFIDRLQNGSGGALGVNLQVYALVEFMTSCQINMTVV